MSRNWGLKSQLRPQPVVHPFEFGSSLLFLFVIMLPIALVGGLCIGYAAFAPEPIKYQHRVEAEAFKGH